MSDKLESCGRLLCGHDRSSHHEGRDNCLAAFCGCRHYVLFDDEAPTAPVAEPAPEPKPVPMAGPIWWFGAK